MGIIDFTINQVKSQGLTLSILSKRTGIDPAYLSRILNKHISPSANIIDKLLEALGFDCQNLVNGSKLSSEITGELLDFSGKISDLAAHQKILLTPYNIDYLLRIKSDPFTGADSFPQNYLVGFSKTADVGEGDSAVVFFKEKGRPRKIFRYVHYQKAKVILSSPSPNIFNIVVLKKNIIKMHRAMVVLKRL